MDLGIIHVRDLISLQYQTLYSTFSNQYLHHRLHQRRWSQSQSTQHLIPSTLNTDVKHPDHKRPVLKRIPKGARPVAAKLLNNLILPSAVKTAIQTFPNGSAGGPDSLRPQHIKDLLQGATDDSPLLMSITDLTNLLLEGKVPSAVRGALFGANLLAIAKKNGGIRPIAVGYVWRRLAAKVACSHVKEAATTGSTAAGFRYPRWCRS